MTRALVLVAALAAPVAAETHGGLAAGGLLRIDAPSIGGWALAELWPGGLWGARLDLEATSGPTLAELSVARALGATWRHVVVSVHAGAGADLDRAGLAIAAGLSSEVGLGIGPLALVTDISLHGLVWDGRRDVLVTFGLGIAAVF